MKRNYWIALIVLVVLIILVLLFARKPSIVGHPFGESQTYELAQEATGVQTSAGTKDLPAGTLITVGASNVNYDYVTLTAATTMLTTQGAVSFPVGSLIHCDPPPGMPSPCG